MVDWDRTRDWVLHRFWHDRLRVTIRFAGPVPMLAELVALRKRLPQVRDTQPGALRESLGSSGVYPLGELPTSQARPLVEALRAHSLEVVAECASAMSYLQVDRTTGNAWLIEDDDPARAVANAMLAAGVPVPHVEE